jgi:hypothetical protein
VAGSGDAAEPGVYQHLYLKSDLEYVCHGSEHLPVLVVSVVLWMLYAVGCPLVLAWIIRRHQADTEGIHGNNELARARGEPTRHIVDDYWRSCMPLTERF